MAKREKKDVAGSALLPTVNKPGTYEWCEEVVECLNMAWRSKETSELAFLAAVRAAVEHRIWETLSPPPPEDPFTSLDGLIRRTADKGQAENMQIAIRFSGILAEGEPAADREAARGALPLASAPSAPPWEVSAAVPGPGPSVARPLTAEDEIALGNALLDQYAGTPTPAGDVMAEAGHAAGPPAAAPVSPRRTAGQRKRDRLERTHPEIAEAVDAGEMTLQQAYIEAGIDKANPNLDKLQRIWRAASVDERDRFLNWIDEQEGRESREEYHKAVYGDDRAQ